LLSSPLLQWHFAPGVQVGIGTAAIWHFAPGVQVGIGTAAIWHFAPGVQVGIGTAAATHFAPGVQVGIGTALTAWRLGNIEPKCEVANAAEAPAIHIPRTRVLTANFMTVVLLTKVVLALLLQL